MLNLRKGIFLALLVAFVSVWIACGGSDTTEPLELPPPAAGNPMPANDAADVPHATVLQWSGVADPDGGDVKYDVYLGLSDDPPLVAEDLTTNSYQPVGVHSKRMYHWRVVAKDDENHETSSNVWAFTVMPCPPTPGTICDFAGTGIDGLGPDGQDPLDTELYWPQDVNFDASGNPHILDWNNHRVLVVDAQGKFKTLIGGKFGDGLDGFAADVRLNHPTHVSFDPADDSLILCAWHNSVIKRMDMNTTWLSTFCGTGARDYNGDEIPAEDAILDLPVNLIFDSQGRMYLGDQANMAVRMIDEDGIIHTVAGMPTGCGIDGQSACQGFTGDGGPATQARLNFEKGQAANPSGKICFDNDGNLLIADTKNHCVRIVDAGGIINTFAGTGANAGSDGDGGLATAAHLTEPRDITVDAAGNVYIADTGNHCVRKVDAAGIITTVAGTIGVIGADSFDAIPATQAHFYSPYGIEIGPNGNLWIADSQNSMVRIVYLP